MRAAIRPTSHEIHTDNQGKDRVPDRNHEFALIKWTAVGISLATPFAVVNMTSAYVDNGFAMARVALSDGDAVRLSQLYSDARSLPAADVSILLSRHNLNSIDGLEREIEVAQANVASARADALITQNRLLRNTAVGLLCVAISSLAAIAFANLWPRQRTFGSVAAG